MSLTRIAVVNIVLTGTLSAQLGLSVVNETVCDVSTVTFRVSRPSAGSGSSLFFLGTTADTNPHRSTLSFGLGYAWLPGELERLITVNTNLVPHPVEVRVQANDTSGNVGFTTLTVVPNLLESVTAAPVQFPGLPAPVSQDPPPAAQGTIRFMCPVRPVGSPARVSLSITQPQFVAFVRPSFIDVVGGGQTAVFDIIPLVFPKDVTAPIQAQIVATGSRNTRTTTVTVLPPTEKPDLSITKIEPVQVTYNPDANNDGTLDLVLGKATAFRAELAVNDRSRLPDTSNTQVRVLFDGTEITGTVAKTCGPTQLNGCFGPDNKAILFINPSPVYRPLSDGPKTLSATVNPPGSQHVPESDDPANSNNTLASMIVNVKPTRSFKISYVGVKRDSDYGSLSPQAAASVSEGNAFIRRVYPIADDFDLGSLRTDRVTGFIIPGLGVLADFHEVHMLGRAVDPTAERVIGIVPPGYFQYHLFRHTKGLTPASPHTVSLVTEGYDTVAAHELGHQFGISSRPEEYEITPPAPGRPARGFWVAGNEQITNAYCFMGNQPFFRNPTQLGLTWIDNQDYQFLFSKLKATTDPEILLVGIIVSKDGSLEVLPWRQLSGFPTEPPQQSEYRIQILDYAGRIVATTPLLVEFLTVTDPVTLQKTETGKALITVAIEYPTNAGFVRIDRGTTPVFQAPIASKLLSDAIQAIPDHGFHSNPDQRRRTLLNKVAALDIDIALRNSTGTIQKLRNDIRKHITEWLRDGYTTETPLAYTKDQVLALIDNLLAQMQSR